MRKCLVELLDKVSWADIVADSAMLTLGIVNTCQVMVDVNCAMRTLLFTQFAAHTAGFAEFTGDGAFFYVVAWNGKTCGIGNHNNHVFWASVFACFTTFAFFAVNYSNAVNNMNCIEFTYFHTVAMTETAVCTVVHTVTE